MTGPAFSTALAATGYLLPNGDFADGLYRRGTPAPARVRQAFSPAAAMSIDAVFMSQGSPVSLFKDMGEREPEDAELDDWHEIAWNVGLAPLLWIVTPTEVRLFNCYEKRKRAPRAGMHVGRATLRNLEELTLLDREAGRLATESGSLWNNAIGSKLDRKHRVDRQLLAEIGDLETVLAKLTARNWLGREVPNLSEVPDDMRVSASEFAQKLIARTILAWYVVDRRLADKFLPDVLQGGLPAAFADEASSMALFDWLQGTFNGDLYPKSDLEFDRENMSAEHASLLGSFSRSEYVKTGQGRLFKFRFDSIPIDLLSSVYQQFARSLAGKRAKRQSLHYTSVELADMVLEPVFDGLPIGARVLDPTCGSGIFLVEALRRLVWQRCGDLPPSRSIVRELLYGSVHGADVNPAALRVAAFSLVLAALELDSEPVAAREDLHFDRLIGHNLHEIDFIDTPAETLKATLGTFDAVVGNPPWTFVAAEEDGEAGAAPEKDDGAAPRRSPDHGFVRRAATLLKDAGRIGLILKATPFFTLDRQAEAARMELIDALSPVAIVNLSQLRLERLFPAARGAALIFLARCPLVDDQDHVLVGSAPWTPTFRRSGAIQIGPGDFRKLPLAALRSRTASLKAACFGTLRDNQLMERLEEEMPTLAEVLDAMGIDATRRGQGMIVGSAPTERELQADPETRLKNPKLKPLPQWLRTLPFYSPDVLKGSYKPFRIAAGDLAPYGMHHPERARDRMIYEGPLLLCPKGRFNESQPGRYSAATSTASLAYTQQFFGVSFADADPATAEVLSGFLNSALTSFQLALRGSAVGIERPAVSPQDVLSLRIPFVSDWRASDRDRVVARHAAATEAPTSGNLASLDEAVFELARLDHEERTIVRESVRRYVWMFVDGREQFRQIARTPSMKEFKAYANAVVRSIDAYLVGEDRHFEADILVTGGDVDEGDPAIAALSFRTGHGEPGPQPIVRASAANVTSISTILRNESVSGSTRAYLDGDRTLRLYRADDMLVLKPAEWRHWTESAGLSDADAILADHRIADLG